MKLREYLRIEFNNIIRPIFIKNECEVCKNNNDLHLHHCTHFIYLLEQTLNELNLKELNINEYNKSELKLISNIMLGKQLKIEYKTLCSNCHNNIHIQDTKPKIKTINTNKNYLTIEDLSNEVGVSTKTINKWDIMLLELNILQNTNEYNYFSIDKNGVLNDCTKQEYYNRIESKYYYRVKKYKTNTENSILIETLQLIKNLYGYNIDISKLIEDKPKEQED